MKTDYNPNRGHIRKIEDYILSAIDSESYDVAAATPKEKIEFFVSTFIDEYGHTLNHYKNVQRTLTEYLQCLPSTINLPFETHDIIQFAIEHGALKEGATDAQVDRWLNTYWPAMAMRIISLARRYNVEIPRPEGETA